MNRRYGMLVLAILVAIVGLTIAARRPRSVSTAAAPAPAVPAATLALTIADGRVSPEAAAVPKGHRVQLEVVNRDGRPHTFRLTGYEDRVRNEVLPAGAAWQATFIADRPGDDFAWMVDDQPAGRLAVTGSHLIEGHR